MANLSKEDLLKVARLSALEIKEDKIEIFSSQLKKVLGFIDQITNVDTNKSSGLIKNENIFREDVVYDSNPIDLLKLAPKTQENYFTVPKILNESRDA